MSGDEKQEVSAIPLVRAVFCAGCETISNSPHDVCSICGSHSLTNLSRLLGRMPPREKVPARTAKYNLELTANVHEISAIELNHFIQSLTRLAAVGGDPECLHISVEPICRAERLVRAA